MQILYYINIFLINFKNIFLLKYFFNNKIILLNIITYLILFNLYKTFYR